MLALRQAADVHAAWAVASVAPMTSVSPAVTERPAGQGHHPAVPCARRIAVSPGLNVVGACPEWYAQAALPCPAVLVDECLAYQCPWGDREVEVAVAEGPVC